MKLPVVLALLALAGRAHADELPFVYDRAGAASGWRVDSETAAGTRDTRPIGSRGIEQAVRVRRGLGRVTLDARAGVLVGDDTAAGGSLEAGVQLGGVLTLGAGVGLDYRGDPLVRGRGSLRRDFGRLTLGASGLVEKAFADDRDVIDVVLGAGASWQLGGTWRAGGELLAEDLEGFWDDTEAEGGAKLLVGPTLGVTIGGYDLTLNAGAVVQASQQAPGAPPGTETGFMGRLLVGRSF